MNKQEKIKKFRKALHVFWIISLEQKIENGELDWAIWKFLEGAELQLTAKVDFIANDIIFMNALLDGEQPTQEVIDNFKKLKNQ